MMNTLQYISIFIEALIAVLGILIAVKKKRIYGWGIFLTFGIYVFYDLAKLIPLNIPQNILYPIFFVGTLSILWAVWEVYKNS